MEDWKNTKCGTCIIQRQKPICNSCMGHQFYKPMSNADRIRSMNDEELADMLHNIGSYVENGNPLVDIYIGDDKSTVDDSFGFLLEWLQSEVKGSE